MRLNSPLQCEGSCRTDPVLPVLGVGRNKPNGGASALLCATPHGWQWWSLGEGTTEARVSAGRCAELWASAGAAPGVGSLGGGGGQESSPTTAQHLQCRSRHEPPWGCLQLPVRLQAGEKPNFYLLLI